MIDSHGAVPDFTHGRVQQVLERIRVKTGLVQIRKCAVDLSCAGKLLICSDPKDVETNRGDVNSFDSEGRRMPGRASGQDKAVSCQPNVRITMPKTGAEREGDGEMLAIG
ncbi:hypothetical protein LU298_14030 [Komagataeibacter intermedius]|uniref:hypothetical protein n=1 Tax=Komagataeibacter intermedius TaxID=66229 RepID=UPI001300F8C2|nr:hypothetical protein [Komagataeibacter intermedius]MCF3637609.1 hypothetical protein [Komagataeibacter intermedius]